MNAPDLRGHVSLLATFLDVMVPLCVAGYERRGGPRSHDLDRARSLAAVLAEQADVLLFGGAPSAVRVDQYGNDRRGEAETAGSLLRKLADVLAVMSFCPGGVRFCERDWLAASGWPYEVCGRCRTRHAGQCPEPETPTPEPAAEFRLDGRRIIARFRRDGGAQ